MTGPTAAAVIPTSIATVGQQQQHIDQDYDNDDYYSSSSASEEPKKKPLKKLKLKTKNAFKNAARKVRGKKKDKHEAAVIVESSSTSSSILSSGSSAEDVDSTRVNNDIVEYEGEQKVVQGNDFEGKSDIHAPINEHSQFKSPMVEVATSDYSLYFLAALSGAFFVTATTQLTTTLVVSWMAVAFIAGRAVSQVPWHLLQDENNEKEKDVAERRRKSHCAFFKAMEHVPHEYKHVLFTPTQMKETKQVSKKERSSSNEESHAAITESPDGVVDNKAVINKNVRYNSEGSSSVISPETFGQFVDYENSLHDHVPTPMVRYRGVDVFLSDDGETSISSHPAFIKKGMRDVPTFLMNILTQWGNILIYFEIPSWFESFEDLKVEESDSMEIKALKGFLLGDNNYRNKRFRMIPELAEAPSVVKMVMPNKQEYLVHNNWSPLTWKNFEREETSDGKVLKPSLECVLDCMNSAWTRGMCSVGKKQAKKVTLDIAFLLGGVDAKGKPTPSIACFGLFRMHHIDVCGCPEFPDRYADQEGDPDFLRASAMMSLTSEEQESLHNASSDDE